MKPLHVLLLITALILSFILGRCSVSDTARNEMQTHRVDTIRDTIPIKELSPVSEIELLSVPELVPMYITLPGDTVHDTIYITLPITQKKYETENFSAWISGYKPQLDSINIYKETLNTFVSHKQRRFGIGLIAGYGIGRNGLSPYIGVGGFYRIW